MGKNRLIKKIIDFFCFHQKANILSTILIKEEKFQKNFLNTKELIHKIYNQYSLDEQIIKYHNNYNSNKKITLPKRFKRVNIEIGFGNGDFLIKNAISYPNELFIGIEVYLNGIAKVLTNISKIKLENIILSHLNSIYFLEAIPYRSVDKIFIINPDPWIKKTQ